jgi:hypothetical protein
VSDGGSGKLKALKGRTIVDQGKRESVSASPWVKVIRVLALFAKPRDSANLVCGPLDSETSLRLQSTQRQSATVND